MMQLRKQTALTIWLAFPSIRVDAMHGGDEMIRKIAIDADDRTAHKLAVDHAANINDTFAEPQHVASVVRVREPIDAAGRADESSKQDRITREFSVLNSSAPEPGSIATSKRGSVVAADRANAHPKEDRATHEFWVDFAGDVKQSFSASQFGASLVRKITIDAAGSADEPSKQDHTAREMSIDPAINGNHNSSAREYEASLVRKIPIDEPGRTDDPWKQDFATRESWVDNASNVRRKMVTDAPTLQDEELRQKSRLAINLKSLLLVVLLWMLFHATLRHVSFPWCGILWVRRLAERQHQQDHAAEDLRFASAHAIQHALLSQKDGDWRHTLNKLRRWINKGHPLYTMIEVHMDEPGIKTQLHCLFSKLSEGEELLTTEKLYLFFTNLYMEHTNFCTGQSTQYPPPAEWWLSEWLLNNIEQPLTFPMFLSIFVVFWLIVIQYGIVLQEGSSSNRIAKAEPVWQMKGEYYVEIRGHVVFRGSFEYGKRERSSGNVT